MAATTEIDAVAPTGNPYLDTLIQGNRYVDGPITYFFDDTDGTAQTAPPTTGRRGRRTASGPWFDTFAEYIPMDFVEVDSAADANFILRQDSIASMGGATASFEYPDASGQAVGLFPYDWNRWSEEHLQKGGYAFHTVLHEVGHALGLAHPHGSNGVGGSRLPA